MNKIIIATTLALAASAAAATGLCQEGRAFLDRLHAAGVKTSDLDRYADRAERMCASVESQRGQPTAPKTEQEYRQKQQREQQQRLDEMRKTPEVQPIRLWG